MPRLDRPSVSTKTQSHFKSPELQAPKPKSSDRLQELVYVTRGLHLYG